MIRARRTLETAGVAVNCEVAPVPLSPEQESVLALALREAVTNVLRHAQAQNCVVRLARQQQLCTLEVADDGCGGCAPEGNGLRGMRERLEALGGSLARQTKSARGWSFNYRSLRWPPVCETEGVPVPRATRFES